MLRSIGGESIIPLSFLFGLLVCIFPSLWSNSWLQKFLVAMNINDFCVLSSIVLLKEKNKSKKKVMMVEEFYETYKESKLMIHDS
jgi:hypothetical protein